MSKYTRSYSYDMFYIYKKTHNVTGLKYLGYTKNDPFRYKGSGTRWIKHLNIHGNDVTTEILRECNTKCEVKEYGQYYSKLWNVVESRDWANMKVEEGNGGDMSSSEAWVNSRKNVKFRQTQAERAKGNSNVRNYKWWYNELTGQKTRSLECPGVNWSNKFEKPDDETRLKLSESLSGRTLSDAHKLHLKESAKNRPSNAKGTVWVKNKEGQRKRVDPNNIPEGYERVNNE